MAPRTKSLLKTAARLLLAGLILFFVGRQFLADLTSPRLRDLHLRPGWLVLAAAAYPVGLGFSALFWRLLLGHFGHRPGTFALARAYFVSHLGKYVPGKALALWLRGLLLRGRGVPMGAALATAFYEVLTTMAAGGLVAAVLFALFPPRLEGLAWNPFWTGMLLLGAAGAPLLPGIFNFLVRRLQRKYPGTIGEDPPALDFGHLLMGLGLTALGWGVLGWSVWATLQGVLGAPPPLTAETWLRITAATALAYVAGFLTIFLPGGIGMREYFLLNLLRPYGADALVAAAVLLLRLLWTGAELLLGGLLFLLGSKTAGKEKEGARSGNALAEGGDT